MKTKQLLAIILVIVISATTFILPTLSASATTYKKVTDIKQTNSTPTSVSIKWKGSTGTQYNVRVYTTDKKLCKKAMSSFPYCKATIKGLKSGQRYYVRVRATDGLDSGEWSGRKYIKTKLNNILNVNQINKKYYNKIYLKWNAVSKASSYDVYFYSNKKKLIKKYNPVNNYKTISNLSSDTFYYVKIRAKNNNFVSNWTSLEKVNTLIKPVKNIKITNITNNSISLTWGLVSTKKGYSYHISYKENNNTEGNYKTIKSKDNKTTLKDLKSNTSYKVLIRAKRIDNSISKKYHNYGIWSEPLVITTKNE